MSRATTNNDKKAGPPVSLIDRRALLDHHPAPPEIIEAARVRKEVALTDLGIYESVLTTWILSKCFYHLPTTAIDTMAVTASGDGTCFYLYNPYFTLRLATNDDVGAFIFHEGRHLMQRHLWTEPELRVDDVYRLANEVTINHVMLTRLRRRAMPQEILIAEDGTQQTRPTGVNPHDVYKRYKEDLITQGASPVTYERFSETDFGCYTELKRMQDPPTSGGDFACIHQDGDGEGGGGAEGAEGPVPMDQGAVDEIMKQALQNTMTQARQGHERARQELLEAASRSEDGNDRIKQMWGSYGIQGLRGTTDATRKVEWWKQWLTDTLSSKLRGGYRLIFPAKRAGILTALGMDPMLARRGKEHTKVVAVFYDTSGSMPDRVIKWLTDLVGHTDGVETHWFMFDGVVKSFVPGESVHGGGGTNFQNCVDVAEGRLTVNGETFNKSVDAVVMVTDGYAPKVQPAEPDKWIWLITEDGDDWPETQTPPMDCHKVISGDS